MGTLWNLTQSWKGWKSNRAQNYITMIDSCIYETVNTLLCILVCWIFITFIVCEIKKSTK